MCSNSNQAMKSKSRGKSCNTGPVYDESSRAGSNFLETFTFLINNNNYKHVESHLEDRTFEEDRTLRKYWLYRHKLFSRFDEGIKTDGEGLFSVTPEALARHQASRCNKPKSMVVDAFTGIGGNAIAFARAGHHVVAIDINPEKIEYARHNARVYGVEEKITFLVGDFFKLAPTLQADVVFLSPPWGGPHYSELPAYSLDMLEPADGVTLFRAASQVADNIMLFVPRHTVIDQLRTLPCRAAAAHARAGVNDIRCEVEHSYLDGRSKGITAYYGAQFARDGESRAAASTNSWRVPRNHCRDSFSSLLKKSSRKPLHSVRAW